MTTIQSPTGGEAAIFTWLADKVLGGAKRAFDWGWDQAKWAAAQDRYDQQIIRDYGEIRIFGQTHPKSLKDVYTDVYVLDRPTAFRRFDPETLAAHLWTEDRGLSFRHGERQPGQALLQDTDKLLILGKPGAGKTTFLKYLAVREAQRGAWGQCLGKIPIFVPLRQLAETGQTPDDLMAFIVDQFAICHFPDSAPFVDKLLREGKALVLFDGLDEVPRLAEPQEDKRGSMALTLERFARQYDRCHIAITSRIAATDYTFDHAFTYLEMADFAPEQVDAFVRAWFWDKKKPDQSAGIATQMLKELEQPEHKGIRDLTRNPLLLTLLCLSYEETLSFPARRVEIYQEATQALLKKWDSSRQIRRTSLYKTLSLGRKEQMFARIAWDGFVAGSVLFAQDDLAQQLVAYLQHVPEMPDAVDIDGEVVLREIVAQHGIFTEQAYHLFSFAHLTFHEYYAARYAVDNAANGTLQVLAAHFDDSKWREVLLLTASLLDDASHLLILENTNLVRILDSSPRLYSWLKWVDEQVADMPSIFSRPAVRLLVSAAGSPTLINLPRNPDMKLDLQINGEIQRFRYRSTLLSFDLPFDIKPDLIRLNVKDTAYTIALEIDPTLTLAREIDRLCDLVDLMILDRSMAIARGYKLNDRARNRIFIKTVMQIKAIALQLHFYDLNEKLERIEIASLSEETELDIDFLSRFLTSVHNERVLIGYRMLMGKVEVIKDEQDRLWSCFDTQDWRALAVFLQGTISFYDCLELSYVPDKRMFEDRIFAPPL